MAIGCIVINGWLNLYHITLCILEQCEILVVLPNILSTAVLKQDESVVSFDVPILYEK